MPRPWRDAASLAAAAALVTGLVSGCAGSSRTYRDYELKAANTAEATVSEVQTARLAVEAGSRGRAFGPYLSVVLGTAERNAEDIRSTFSSRQPPDARAGELHDQLDDLLAQVSDVLRELRIAVRRGDVDKLSQIGQPLTELASRLDAFEQAHS